MKRAVVWSMLGVLALTALASSADAQLFGGWRRSYNSGYHNYNPYYNGWSYDNSGSPYNNMRNAYYGGFYNGTYPPMTPVPQYRTGAYQSGVPAKPAAPAAAAAIAPAAPQRLLIAPDETVISGANVRAGGAAEIPRRALEPIVPGPAGSTSPNVGASANP
ncbi:MAG TPA: hypothetical protein VHY20_00210 [Pirellulales bacterium]|nr:hypothetical protein [Pirellulales bacterium]